MNILSNVLGFSLGYRVLNARITSQQTTLFQALLN